MPPKSRRPPPARWHDSPDILSNRTHFLDRLTVVYGPSETGKTVMSRQIIDTIGPAIPTGTFITRTPKNFQEIPKCFVHEKFDTKLIQDIWNRQGANTEVFNRANNLDVLLKLATRIPSEKIRATINKVEKLRATEKRKLGAASGEFAQFTENCDSLIKQLYKVHISKNRAMLLRKRLSDEEKFTLEYLHFNPRHAIIFDDVTSLIKKFQKKEIIEELFFAARNRFLTVIITMHGDKILDAELRKNAHVSIFMTPTIMHTFFKRESMDFEEKIKQMAFDIANNPEAFENHNKIVFLKQRGPSKHPFVRTRARMIEHMRFGSGAWHRLGVEISGQSTGDTEFHKEFGLI